MLNTTDDLLLRSLDPADAVLSAQQRQRAEHMLQRIISTPSRSDDSVRMNGAPRRRRAWKVAFVAAAAAGIGVMSLAFPGVGGSGISYASWTATPSPVTSDDLQTVARACRDKVSDARGPEGAGIANLATIPVLLAERRGDFVAMLLHQDNPQTSVSCVVLNTPGSKDVGDVQASVGGGDGPAMSPPLGQITQSDIAQFGGRSPASFTDGTVGAKVDNVTIHAGDQSVKATVQGGRYFAWWPGQAFAAEPLPASGQGGPRVIITYDVTLTDGTTKTNVTPFVPPPIDPQRC